MKALIIVDMLKDFVDGKLANPRAQGDHPAPPAPPQARPRGRLGRRLLERRPSARRPRAEGLGRARDGGRPRCRGDRRARRRREGEIISEKQHYGAFDGTGLDEQLRELGVDEVVITGQHTHICVRHSSYGALIRGYEITSRATPSAPSRASARTTRSST